MSTLFAAWNCNKFLIISTQLATGIVALQCHSQVPKSGHAICPKIVLARPKSAAHLHFRHICPGQLAVNSAIVFAPLSMAFPNWKSFADGMIDRRANDGKSAPDSAGRRFSRGLTAAPLPGRPQFGLSPADNLLGRAALIPDPRSKRKRADGHSNSIHRRLEGAAEDSAQHPPFLWWAFAFHSLLCSSNSS